MSVFHVVLAILGIGLLIFLHEMGHFLAARLSGVRVDAFSLGFGPVLFARQRGATEYRLSLVPLGGYVKLAGEFPSSENTGAPDELCSKGVATRAFIFSAGVLMNLLTALVLFPLVFYFGVPFVEPVIGEVVPGGLAWKAGIPVGSRVLSVDGSEVYGFEHIMSGVALGAREGVQLQVKTPDGETRDYWIRPGAEGEPLDRLGLRPIVSRTLTVVVDPESPAARAGLRDGDKILRCNGTNLRPENIEDLRTAMSRLDPMRLEIDREGENLALTVVPEPSPSGARQIGVMPLQRRVLADRRTAALQARLPIREDDILLSVDGKPWQDAKELDSLLETGKTQKIAWLRSGERMESIVPMQATDREGILRDLAIGADLDSSELLVVSGSPAERGGLRTGDRIVQVGDAPTPDFRKLSDSIRASQGPEISIRVQRGAGDSSELLSLIVAPAPYPRFGFDVPKNSYIFRTQNIAQAAVVGLRCSLKMAEDVYLTVRRMLSRELSAKHLGGILQIGDTAIEISKIGFTKLLFFLALLSINLAILNILPIPVLDGGHLLFLLIEKIKGSPVSERVMGYSQVFGLVVLLTLMAFATYNDIRKLFFS